MRATCTLQSGRVSTRHSALPSCSRSVPATTSATPGSVSTRHASFSARTAPAITRSSRASSARIESAQGVTAALERFHAPVRSWFERTLGTPTPVQERGWQAIADGQSVLLLAPTGSGKTLAAFLSALDRLMFQPASVAGVRVVYVSPLKALGIDVERNLRGPIAGILARADGVEPSPRAPSVLVRSGDTPALERARFRRHP